MNMYIPVGSNALETAFQLAITVNFCRAVSGSRGSVAAGGGGGGDEPSFPAWLRDFVAASLLSSQPMLWQRVPGATPWVAEDTNRGDPQRGMITTSRHETSRPRGSTPRSISVLLPLPATSVEVPAASTRTRDCTTLWEQRYICIYWRYTRWKSMMIRRWRLNPGFSQIVNRQ